MQEKEKPHVVEVVCHRGANKAAPENTLAAARQAIAWGAHYIEVDIRTSKDGVLYILHDGSVDRTTDGQGTLRDLTSAEIDRLDAGSWFHPRFKGERIPRLEPYLRWIRGKAKVFFDVKDADLTQLLALVRQVGLEKDCFFWFGRESHARQFRTLTREMALKINASSVEAVERAAQEYQANIIEIGLDRLNEEIRDTCRKWGIRLMVIQMERDLAAYRKIIEWKADLVNLDHPDAFLEVQRQYLSGK